jgi:hypothetical protein
MNPPHFWRVRRQRIKYKIVLLQSFPDKRLKYNSLPRLVFRAGEVASGKVSTHLRHAFRPVSYDYPITKNGSTDNNVTYR